MTGSEDAKQVVITAADSLVDRFSEKVSLVSAQVLYKCTDRIDWMYQKLGRT